MDGVVLLVLSHCCSRRDADADADAGERRGRKSVHLMSLPSTS